MDLYSLIIENKYALEFIYAITIALICAVIVVKTDKYFKLSLHQGIRYFRNAFFFYGFAFMAKYIFGILSDLGFEFVYVAQIIFEYLIIMAGFFLFYSLMWKKFESSNTEEMPTSSLLNGKVAIFHVMAVVISVLDYLWGDYDFLFLSQITVFSCASIIAAVNLRKTNKKYSFPRFYLVAMILSLGAWVLNFLAEKYFNWDIAILIDISIINLLFFLLFLYGVIKVTKIK